MQEIYASLLLHDLGKEINEANLKKVLEAAGSQAEPARIKALVAALEGVNIDEAIKQPAFATGAAPAAAPAGETKKEEKKEESREDQEKTAEAAAGGLSSLFG